MANHPYYREQFEKAIPRSGGLYTVIAERVGCDWYTVKRWIEKDDILRLRLQAEVESTVDVAEAALLKKIKEGDVPSIKFYLTTKGKHRGYVQTTRIEAKYDINKIDFDQLSNEQLVKLSQGLNPDVVFSYEDGEE